MERRRRGRLPARAARGRARAVRLAFAVDDLEATRVELESRGAVLGETRSPVPGVRVADFADAEGNGLSVDEHR